MHTLTVRVTLNKNNKNLKATHMRVCFKGHICASDVEYIENLLYFIRNRVLPTGRIPNLDFGQTVFPPEYFDYLLKA